MYQAILGDIEIKGSRSYAVKVVVNGGYEEKMGRLQRLRHEFQVYCRIAQAKRDKKLDTDVTANCYGLYGSADMLALVLDYEGDALTCTAWSPLPPEDR